MDFKRDLIRLSPGIVFFVIVVGSLLLMLFPYVSAGIDAVHFTQDPDMAYLGNGLNFLARGEIYFALHPGVPTQILIAATNLPFLIFCKVTGANFEDWIYRNFDFILYFNRISQSILLSTAIGLWTFAVWRMTSSLVLMLLAWSFLFIYGEIPTYGMALLNENAGFFILSLWLLVLTQIFRSDSQPKEAAYRVLILLSALGLANKFTNIFMPMISLLLPQLDLRSDLRSRLKLFGRHFSLFFFSCILFFWPIRAQLKKIGEWLFSLATHTGIYGTGQNSAFSLDAYLSSVRELLLTHSKSYLILAGCLVFLFVAASRKKENHRFYWLLIAVTLLIGAIFSKYVLVRYQLLMMLTTYAFGLAAFQSVFANYRNLIRLVSITLILVLASPIKANVERQYHDIGRQIRAAKILKTYLENVPEEQGTIVEVAFVRDYSRLFFRNWSNGLLNAQMIRDSRKVFYFNDATFRVVRSSRHEVGGTMDVCWDRLLIQDVSVRAFLEANANHNFVVEKIEETPTTAIKSTHCKEPK